jgi:hypothetical protein
MIKSSNFGRATISPFSSVEGKRQSRLQQHLDASLSPGKVYIRRESCLGSSTGVVHGRYWVTLALSCGIVSTDL